jgi:hypothetical protein
MSLAELTDRAAVLKAIEEYDRLGQDAFLVRYGFGRARNYVLREAGKDYDSKAIVGAAFGYQFPERGPLRFDDFHGGEKTVQRRLKDLGFHVIRLAEAWSREEVERTVADYFDMLALEAGGEAYSKTEHRERLKALLLGRSDGSVEFKHQNISAVLDEIGLPYIRGYKPRSSVQELLRDVVRETISARRAALATVVDGFEVLRLPADPNYRAALVEPPTLEPEDTGTARPRMRIPRKLDYAARDEHNRTLGRAGEGWTIGFENQRLTDLDRGDLAQRVDWVSDRLGDGAGYDILSFERDAAERYIEVKTTNGSALTPFVLSANEVAFSQEVGAAFCLYRLFDYGSAPRLFILRGDLTAHLSLAPLDFRARLKAITGP